MRSFLASLLHSDLTSVELQDLADDLTYGSFGKELGDFIRDAMLNLGNVGPRQNEAPYYEPSPIRAYDLVTRKKMPKKIVQQLMMLASPNIRPKELQATKTVKDLLDWYFDMAPPNEIGKFLSILEGEPADAYLKGISQRSRVR